MRRVVPWIAVAGAVVLASCGSSKPPTVGDVVREPEDAGATFASNEDAGFECVKDERGEACGCTELSLVTDVPNLYFVLDRSGSMSEDGKWTTIRGVVANVARKLGPRAAFGITLFPGSSVNGCQAGREVLPTTAGMGPAGQDTPLTKQIISSTSVAAMGGTPTSETLRGVRSRVTRLPGRTFVVLATDGAPNCNAGASCDVDGCILNIEQYAPECKPGTLPNCCDPSLYGPGNCVDGAETEAEVAALHAAGIPTYVVGVPGSAAYADLLGRLAEAGGTARAQDPKYYRVDQTDTLAFDAALASIAAKITASCSLELSEPPADPNLVNVYLDGAAVPLDGADGWSLDGATITLNGPTCVRVLSGQALNLRVIAGCKTVVRAK